MADCVKYENHKEFWRHIMWKIYLSKVYAVNSQVTSYHIKAKHCVIQTTANQSVLLKALPPVYMKYTARGES